MHPLLVATTNAGKLREMRDLLDGLPFEFVSLVDFPGLAEPEEHGQTFEENAALKARYYSLLTGLLTVADDSGLEIDALGGRPGVYSARFEGDTFAEKFARVYAMLDERGARSSPACFICAIALARGEDIVFSARGVVEGRIADAPRGDQGFGYDPIFLYPPLGLTLAEIPLELKRTISHRGHAIRALRAHLESRELAF